MRSSTLIVKLYTMPVSGAPQIACCCCSFDNPAMGPASSYLTLYSLTPKAATKIGIPNANKRVPAAKRKSSALCALKIGRHPLSC